MEHSCSVALPPTPSLSSTDIPVVTPPHPHAACSISAQPRCLAPSASDASSFPQNETSPHQLPSGAHCAAFCYQDDVVFHPHCSHRHSNAHVAAHVLRFSHQYLHHSSKKKKKQLYWYGQLAVMERYNPEKARGRSTGMKQECFKNNNTGGKLKKKKTKSATEILCSLHLSDVSVTSPTISPVCTCNHKQLSV